ncbi:hypothetical protein DYBT9275_04542 [Dyadobacter sp. CECT 9275]|uniref:Heparinase n=1 Tax=Dyadobacter helix TaxID=2822344 RepID=A0A916JI89_9BACT|nr:alginate lyase family protein [Dyadobacter sp. CECT 9275]CAG5009647.1 hypothetical protein DYBT9275_04542 [Dyadobacter sp. CECT 9275]
MTRFLNLFQLFRNMGFRYAAFRSWHEFQLRTGLLKRRFPVDKTSGTFMTKEQWYQQGGRFFLDGKPGDETLSGIPFLPEEEKDSLKQKVERLYAGTHLFFSSTWYTVTGWHTNPETGYRYDRDKHWTEIPDFSKQAGDIKYVWERSRFTFLYDLIRYDHHFKEDQSEKVFYEIEDWIKANPVNCGPNWRCSQEISLRVLNWTFALYYYKYSDNLTAETFQIISRSMDQQMRHVAENIQFSRIAVRNNHAITETLTLYLVGLLYPFFPESERWKENGKKWFEQEIEYQIDQDGTYLQFSMNYHRVVVQLLTWGLKLSELNGEQFSDIVYDRAEKSLQFLRTCQDDTSGWLPNYGNNDGALFFPLTNSHFRDYRPQLSALAGTLKINLGYSDGIWQEEAGWLGVTDNLPVRKISGGSGAFEFASGGYYLLKEKESLTFLRCGNYKNRPFQADNLHLDLWVNGENILRDAGTFKYNTDEKLTQYFAGTASHNTVMPGDFDQMRKGPRFIWYDWIHKSEGKWTEEGEDTVFEGSFEGFRQAGNGIVHYRRVRKNAGRLRWEVEDRMANIPAGISMCQHWHPSEFFPERFSLIAFDHAGTEIPAVASAGWYSGLYGQKTESRQLTFSSRNGYIRTVIERLS